jgi:hypothetical protein
MKRIKESKALTEVWSWKEEAYNEVKHLDIEAAVSKRIEGTLATTHRLGFTLSHIRPKYIANENKLRPIA